MFNIIHDPNTLGLRFILISSQLKPWSLIIEFHWSFQKQVKDIVHKAFWDLLEEKLTVEPPDYSHLLILLAEMKEVGR